MKHSELKQLIKEEISKVLELRTIDYKPKDDLVHLYLMTYSDKVGEPYFERKYKKFRSDVESLLQSFDAAIEDDHGISDKNLKILVNRKDKIKVKNILTKLSNRYGFESELEIDTLEEIRSVLNENGIFSNRKANIKNARQTQIYSKRVLRRMGALNSYNKRTNLTPDLLKRYALVLKEELEKLKDLLLIVHVDHPSVKGALEYVYEIQQESKDMDPMEIASLLGSGEVIKEYMKEVVQPLKKIFIV
jgi:hypothetical protein